MIDYFIDEKKISKKEFEAKKKEMNNKFGCEAIGTYKDKNDKILAQVLKYEFLKNSDIRGIDNKDGAKIK